MVEIARLINKYWIKVMKPLFKYSVIFFGVTVGGFVLTQTVLLPTLTKKGENPENIQVRKTPGGVSKYVYGENNTPQNIKQELNFNAPQLIHQNQARYYEDKSSENEDIAIGPVVQPREKRRLKKLTSDFLRQWETFSVGESDSSYRSKILPFVHPSALTSVADRIDNRQEADISREGTSGSKAYRSELYTNSGLKILRYDGDSAYGVLTAPVVYTGPALRWKERSYRRSYGLVYQRFNNQWKIRRVAAETIGGSEHLEPGPPPPPGS